MNKFLRLWGSVAAGYVLGMMFAQRSGKELRGRLSKSDAPAKDLWSDLWDSKMEMWGEMKEAVENSEQLQKMTDHLRGHFDALVDRAKDMGDDAVEKVQEELEQIADEAKKAAANLKTEAKKRTTKFKNDLDDGVKTVAKKVKK